MKKIFAILLIVVIYSTLICTMIYFEAPLFPELLATFLGIVMILSIAFSDESGDSSCNVAWWEILNNNF